jgi:hypothetical protein
MLVQKINPLELGLDFFRLTVSGMMNPQNQVPAVRLELEHDICASVKARRATFFSTPQRNQLIHNIRWKW